MMFTQSNLFKARARGILLCMLMILSTTAAIASTASASQARSYTTNRDPHDVAIGDFNCDGSNDIAVATDGTHTITVLWNDGNGDFSERQDIWVSENQSRNADWDEFSNVQFIEVGEFTGDSAIDIVIFQRNNPFRTDDNGAPDGQPGNVTIIENGGCNEKTWDIGARFTHFWAWDLEVSDLNKDGNDDVMILDLQADITTQRVVTYLGPVSSSTQGKVTNLGPAQQNTYRAFTSGDWGEPQVGGGFGGGGQCFDNDVWLLRSEGLDYSTGQVTNPGHDDNVSIIEFNCQTDAFPLTYTFSTTPGPGEHVINMQTESSQVISVADMDGDEVIDVLALNDENIENVTYVTSSAVGNWANPQLAYFGPYISWSLTVTDLNGDNEPDFINPTIAYQQNSTDSAGGSSSSFFLNFPSTIQVTLSDGNGGHLNPLSYAAGRRPHVAEVGQMAGAANSAPDIVVGHKNWGFGGWRDNLGWDGQYDTISVIEMDNKDLSVSGIEIDPVDRYFGFVGEGNRNINVTVTNTGMDVLNGQSAQLDVELKIVDELNSTNQTVYAMDWDNPENKAGCAGCTWDYIDYVDGTHHWFEETNHSSGTGVDPDESESEFSPSYLNPTDFMWTGETKTNDSGGTWTGYGKNWDEAMILQDVDLTGSDRAFLSVELYQDLGWGGLGSASTTGGFILTNVWDDIAMIEVGSEETGWDVISCPTSAAVNGACYSGRSMWGGFDIDRYIKGATGGYPEGLSSNIYSFNSYYGWNNFTDEGFGTFDLSPWAGETIDLRFRFRTGFDGSIADDNQSRWTGYDGFAVDNLTITKQNTAFFPNAQAQQTQVNLQNLGPGEEYTTSIQANFLNDTTYRISATLSNNGWDEQVINDEIVGYVTPFNLYDPVIEKIDDFLPGGLYAQGTFPITATTNNYGNTAVDFDITATVFTANPSDVNCGTPSSVCEITFDNSTDGTRYTESNNPKGVRYNDSLLCPGDPTFNKEAYWFGHPCSVNTGIDGYGDAWENETLTVTNVDLENLSGDFVSLNFEYYADTFYEVDSQGGIDPSDYLALYVDYTNNGRTNEAIVYGQWSDYNEDGTCQEDRNGDGIVNATEPIDFGEIDFIGDPRNTDGLTNGNWNVFFNSDGLTKTVNIDLTHLYVYNISSSDSSDWGVECLSLSENKVDLKFEFFSDDDGRNGINDGFKGVGITNISLKEFTFVEDNSYTITRNDVDAGESSTDLIASHEFVSGVYMVEVETVFDNSSAGTPWFGATELNDANNIKRVIFNVKSVDITLGKPQGVLECLTNPTLNCVLPIDQSLTHSWDVRATNGVLEGDYVFYMDIFDETSNSLAHTVSAGPATELVAGQVVDLSFTPWSGYQDGHTYNISYRAELDDGTPSGTPRFFHATFAEDIDVAILSDKSTGTSTIVDDLTILGKSYTQFTINDWDEYFKTNWFTHYDKIILPWQDTNTASDAGGKYYLRLSEDDANTVDRKQILESYMLSGGTIQAHFAPHGTQTYGDGLTNRLPLDVEIDDRKSPDEIKYSNMEIYDKYHPIMDDIDDTNNYAIFQGFDANKVVARSVLDAGSADEQADWASICTGNLGQAEFQPIIRTKNNPGDVLLGVCSYGQGGMIISTIDIEANSEDATSSTFPLLKNILLHQVTDYPNPFGKQREGTDILINDAKPVDGFNSGYVEYYVKSNAELTFGYQTDAMVSLTADWVIEGPTSWDGSSLAADQSAHTDQNNPVMTFCKSIGTQGACKQDVQWTVTLWLHDDEGHSRKISVVIETDDANADEFDPVPNAIVEIRPEYAENIELIGSSGANNEWDKYRIILDEDGQIPIYFNASSSYDEDAPEGSSGIKSYQWDVYYDKAQDAPLSALYDTNTYTQSAASQGVWMYTFGGFGVDDEGLSYASRNITVDEATNAITQPIKVKLTVFDEAGNWDDDMEIYFEVLDAGFGDVAPVVVFDDPDMWKDKTGYNDSEFTISGTVVSGSDDGDFFMEIAFDDSLFDGGDDRINSLETQKLAVVRDLASGDEFSLTLNLSDLYSNVSKNVEVYIFIYEWDSLNEKRWTTHNYGFDDSITLTLPKCRGETVPNNVLAEDLDGRWIFVNGVCQWEGDWKFENGQWIAPSSDDSGDSSQSSSNLILIGGGALILVVILGLTILLLRKNGDEGMDGMVKDFSVGGYQQDPVEQYVQQLIAQGYPEDTARAYAAQYASQAGGGQQMATTTQAATSSNPAMDAAYQQYYQQFISQGYDQQTAAAYAQQYAAAYIQQQQ